MKKVLFIFCILCVLTGLAMADDTRNIKPSWDWDFDPEVSTTAGWNMDTSFFGLEGTAKLDLETTIYKEADLEMVGEGDYYGKIVVNDLEIQIDTNEQNEDYDSDTTTTRNPIVISWNAIEGTVYLGPVYVKLSTNATAHDEVEVIETLDDGDLDFTNIEYSIIDPYYSATFGGRVLTGVESRVDVSDSNGDRIRLEGVSLVNDVTTISRNGAITESTDGQTVDNSFPENNYGAFVVGFATEQVTIELGYSTEYTYREKVNDYYNPQAVSLKVDVTPIENLTLHAKGSVTSGYNGASVDDGILGVLGSEGNPITTGASTVYTMPMGSGLKLKAALGGELQFMTMKRIATSTYDRDNLYYDRTLTGLYSLGPGSWEESENNLYIFNSSAYADGKNGEELYMPYEVALGLTLDWSALGINDEEDEWLDLANGDIDATDGASISFAYGQVPHEHLRDLKTDYIGFKLALWESEDGEKQGIVPGLKAGLITNLNYVFGFTEDIKDLANGYSTSFDDLATNVKVDGQNENDTHYYSKYEYKYEPRLDFGIGTEISYELNEKIAPFAGVIFKWFDITESEAKVTQEYKALYSGSVERNIERTTTYDQVYGNQQDLRLRLGTDIKVISKTTLTAQWVSGDLLNEVEPGRDTYGDDYDYFENNNAAGSVDPQNTNTDAKLGYISFGATIEF